MEHENLLDSRQHGFRRNRSCTTSLSIFLNDLTSNMDETNMLAGVVYVDFIWFCSTIETFASSLRHKDPGNYFIILVSIFFEEILQNKTGGIFIAFFSLFRGVPQGSILAPLLFSLFFNGVGSATKSKFYGLFADDLSITFFNRNLGALITELSQSMESINNWCRERDLIISFAKTKYMIFSKKP